MRMKFLIIRFSSIGDIVLTTPVIRSLRKKFPDAGIHYLTKKSFTPIVEANPYLSKIHVLTEDFEGLVTELKSENFDAVIDLHNNLRTFRIKKLLGKIPAYSFEKLNVQKWIFTSFKINMMPAKHIVDRYMETLHSFHVENDGLGLDYFIPDKDIVKQTDLPTSHVHGYIAIVIGAAHNTKKLPVYRLKELCMKIVHPVILLGGPEDFANALEISSADPVKIYNACGKYNLNESADLLRRSKLVISHDTGLMHIAAAFKKNILSVWGNTVPSFGMVPYKTSYEIFEVKKLWCRPCSKIGYVHCPRGHFKCMKNISIDQVVTSVNLLLSR
ncbi:MAG: glycosyltransferase family 9 protein [Ginsengibacter sp.]